ncbi:MAG TPA: hypothetical protein VMU17_06560 [Elusimicrobiota bacterium]|nr:hypothetical protein [Elusimicrobiota bacterium]
MNSAAPGMDMNGMGDASGMAAAGTAKEIAWKVPPGWVEQAPSAMRIGSFLIKGDNGQTSDVSVVPLSGEAGGDLANINRWRGQINLHPVTEAELPNLSETLTPAGRRMRVVDFVSDQPLINNQYRKRVIAAMYSRGNRTWFFKMVGDDATTEAAKPSFLRFLRSLKFNDVQ